MTLKQFIAMFAGMDNQLGDFAKDVARDRNAPEQPEEFIAYINYHPLTNETLRKMARLVVELYDFV